MHQNQTLDELVLKTIQAQTQGAAHSDLRSAIIRSGIPLIEARHCNENEVWRASEMANRACQRLRKRGLITHKKQRWSSIPKEPSPKST